MKKTPVTKSGPYEELKKNVVKSLLSLLGGLRSKGFVSSSQNPPNAYDNYSCSVAGVASLSLAVGQTLSGTIW